ncbi:hypothetical protein E2562_006453 [Oryza meyeriana var. granulata]|uniref:Uncharacterized protein n=1 Tax=Oryza meyeriana var. granulata TaxID=110450 RepID=A0A6G1CNW8_9ORYZ|nr:hypothetical protein E2562_006453 [Oryza meyeriana var. granulata]
MRRIPREVSSLRFLMRPRDGDVRQRLSVLPPSLIGDCDSSSAVAASPSDRGGCRRLLAPKQIEQLPINDQGSDY